MSPRTKTPLFVALTVLLVLIGTEATLRLAFPPLDLNLRFPRQNQQLADRHFYRADPDLFWKLRPGAKHGEVNADGYRGPLVATAKPAGQVRIVTLGDSCTFGMGVPIEAIYPTVLAERLRARAGGRAIVLNGAVPGYSSLQAWRSLRRDLARFSPDVATLYVGWNDINPAVYFPDRSQNVWRTHARPVRAVLARSRAYRYLTTLLLAREDPGPRVGPEDFRANLLAFVADCRARAIVPVLLTVPTPTGDFAYNAIVRSVAQGTGAHCLDLAAAMPARDAMFQDDGTHPNAAGHRWIGEALAPALCEAAPALRCGG